MRPPAPARRTQIAVVGAVLAYLAAAWVFYLPLGVLDTRHLPGCACGDLVNQAWFLSLAAHDVTHGELSLFTTRLNYPAGINVLDNASFPLLGVLLTPVTAALGPVASLALLGRLSLFLSALAGLLVLRRLLTSVLAAAVGGAVYAYSPFMAHQAGNHMFLVLAPLPPIILVIVYRQLSSASAQRSLRAGVTLGVLAVVQYLISSEVLVATVVVLTLTLAALGLGALVRRRDLRVPFGVVARLAGGSALVAVPLLAYPTWFALAGRQHVSGPTQAVTAPGIDALATVLPVDDRVVAGLWSGWRTSPVPQLGDTAYLGVVVLALLAYVVITGWHLALVRAAAVLGAISWVLALGPRLVIHGHVTDVPLPFALLTRIPVLQDIIPSRLTLLVDLAAAVLIAVAVDGLTSTLPAGIRRGHRARRRWPSRRLALSAAIAAAVTTLIPIADYGAHDIGAAQAFAGTALQDKVGDGVVLAYPYPAFPEDRAMLWQASGGLRFSLLGGYAVHPDSTHSATKAPPLLAPTAVSCLLLDAWPEHQLPCSGSSPADARAQLPAFIDRYQVTTVVIQRAGRNPQQVIDLFTHAYGPPDHVGPLDIWTHLSGQR